MKQRQKGGVVKYRSVQYIFYVVVKFVNLRFIIRIKLVELRAVGPGELRGKKKELRVDLTLWARSTLNKSGSYLILWHFWIPLIKPDLTAVSTF